MQVDRGVRAAVEAVGREVALVTASAGSRLESAWVRLVDAIALGPVPELRSCPHCGAEGMRAATRCGECWEELTPPPAAHARGGP